MWPTCQYPYPYLDFEYYITQLNLFQFIYWLDFRNYPILFDYYIFSSDLWGFLKFLNEVYPKDSVYYWTHIASVECLKQDECSNYFLSIFVSTECIARTPLTPFQ